MSVLALQKRADDSPFDPDPEQSFTIPARYYLDADILQHEKDSVYQRKERTAVRPCCLLVCPKTRGRL